MHLRTFIPAVSAISILTVSAFAGGFISVPLIIAKNFSAAFVAEGRPVNLTFTITNPNPFLVTGVRVSDDLEFGLQVPTGSVATNTCGGSVAVLANQTISLTGGGLAANSTCTITIPVIGTVGEYFNITSRIMANTLPDGNRGVATLTVIPTDDFQVRYANIAAGDSVINITNTGASSPPVAREIITAEQLPIAHIQAALPVSMNMCVNAYVFSPDEQLVSCCSCIVTPNGLVSLSARNDLVSNTLTPAVPTSLVVKLVASSVTGVSPDPETCDPSTVTPSSIALVTGLAAWGTTLHSAPVTPGTPAGTFGITETPFTVATLSPAELARITTLCGFIRSNGSGFGICKACRLGGLGAGRQSARPVQ